MQSNTACDYCQGCKSPSIWCGGFKGRVVNLKEDKLIKEKEKDEKENKNKRG